MILYVIYNLMYTMDSTLCKQYYACRFEYRIHISIYIYMDYESTSVNRILWIEFYAYHIVYCGIQ